MKTKRRIRRSSAEWQQLIQEQKNSGLKQAAFCKQRSISQTRFGHWQRRLQIAQPDQADANWLELPVLPAPASSGWDIELDLGNGLCLRLHKH